MKRILLSVAVVCLTAAPSLAERVYLSDGSMIEAQSVRREKGRVLVLVNRDTLAEFNTSEVDMKKTFAKKQRTARKKPKQEVVTVQGTSTAAPKQGEMAATQTKAEKKAGGVLTKMPALPAKLPEAKPENLMKGSGDEGSIRKHKKEMAERTGE